MSRLDFTKRMRKDYPEAFEWNYPPWAGMNAKSFVHHSVDVPEWVEIGERVIIHQSVTLGTQGFGFEWDTESKEWLHIPHIGQLIIEDDVEIFEHCNLCRGTVEDTIIGKGTKIDVFCHVGHNCKLGKNCIMTSCSTLGGSTVLGDNVYIGLNSTTAPHITIANGVFIGQASNILKGIAEKNTVWAGNPAKFLRIRKESDG